MNMLFTTLFLLVFIIPDISRVSLFGNFPHSKIAKIVGKYIRKQVEN